MTSTLHELVPALKPTQRDRRTVLTPQKMNVILKYIGKGHTYETACSMASIREKTFMSALEEGRRNWEDHEEFDVPLSDLGKFAQDIHRYRALSDVAFADKLEQALNDDPVKGWVGLFTFKERHHPERYGRKSTVNVQQDTTVHVQFERRSGMDWQMGGQNVQRQITGGDVIDTIVKDEDDE